MASVFAVTVNGLPASKVPRGGARGPVGHVQVVGKVPGVPAVFVVAHAVGELLARVAGVGEGHLVIVGPAEMAAAFLGQQRVVKADAVAGRVDVQLADGAGLVARGREGPGQRPGLGGHGG